MIALILVIQIQEKSQRKVHRYFEVVLIKPVKSPQVKPHGIMLLLVQYIFWHRYAIMHYYRKYLFQYVIISEGESKRGLQVKFTYIVQYVNIFNDYIFFTSLILNMLLKKTFLLCRAFL